MLGLTAHTATARAQGTAHSPLPRLRLVPAQNPAKPFVPYGLAKFKRLDFLSFRFIEVRWEEAGAAVRSAVVVVIEVFG